MNSAGFDSGILRRLLASAGPEIPREAAQFFLSLSLSESDQARVHFLSEKANEGDLAMQERDELAVHVILTDFLAVIQSQARTAMKGSSTNA
jgi:hypothetical protein